VFIPEIALRETLYNTPDGNSNSRELFEGGAELSTTRVRYFGEDYKHTVQPRLLYLYMPDVDQSENPYFTAQDRIPETSRVSFNLDQRLFHRGTASDKSIRVDELVRFEVTQEYDTQLSEFTLFRSEVELNPTRYFTLDSDTRYDIQRGEMRQITARGAIADKRGDVLRARYRRFRERSQQAGLDAAAVLAWGFHSYYRNQYDFEDDRFVFHTAGLEYFPKSDCWKATVEVKKLTRPDETRFDFNIQLFGFGDDKRSAVKEFGSILNSDS